MRALVIGTGAAGNKAVINLLEKGIIPKEDMLLINSTLADIPPKYRDVSIQLSLEQAGCGQERGVARDLSISAIANNKLMLDKYCQPIHSKVIIVSSTDGGSGSGSVPVLSKYCKMVLKMNVEVIGLVGVGDTPRSLSNTVEFFKDLSPDYIVQSICNSSFSKLVGNNKDRYEKLANEELATKIRVSLGHYIVESEQNIDATDLYKLSNTTGYSIIEYKEIPDKIKSIEQFNKILKEMVDDSKSLDSDKPGMQRLGVIVNLPKDSQEFIDYSYKEIKDRLGKPYEIYNHTEDDSTLPRFIAFIAAGMKLPIDEVENMHNKYLQETSNVDKDEDKFFDAVKSFVNNEEDNRFNMVSKTEEKKVNKQDFLDLFGATAAPSMIEATTAKSSKGNKNSSDGMGDF